MERMMIELIVFIALACVCVLVAPFVGLRRRLASEEKKKTHALLKQLESEVGGVLIQHPDLVLSEYELGDGTANLHIWCEPHDLSQAIICWRIESHSPHFAPIQLAMVYGDHREQQIKQARGLRRLNLKSLERSLLFRFQADGASIEMRWLDLFAWLFVHQPPEALAWEDRFPNGNVFITELSIEDGQCIMEGVALTDRENIEQRCDYLHDELELHHGLICALQQMFADFSLAPFLHERVEVLEAREAFVPLHEMCDVMLERASDDEYQTLVRRLLEELHPTVGFGVLETEQWKRAFDTLTDERILTALAALIEARFELTRDERPNISFQPEDTLLEALREEGAKRFSLLSMASIGCERPDIAHGFFELFMAWRAAGEDENDLCAALLVLFPLLSLEQLRFALLALWNGHPVHRSGLEPVSHPAHAHVIASVPLNGFQLRTYHVLSDHAALLAKQDPEWVQTPELLEQLIALVLLYPYKDKPGRAFEVLKEHGDERLLPLLKPHMESSSRIKELFFSIASANELDGMSGRLSVASDPAEVGALSISNLAGEGALTSTESDDETLD
jgi:hypothetical protein